MYKKFKLICVCGETLQCLADMSIHDPNDTAKCDKCGLEWEAKIIYYSPFKKIGGEIK